MPSAEHRERQGQPRPWDLVGKGGEDTWPSRLRPELTVGAEQPCPRSGGWECTVQGLGRGLSAEGQGGGNPEVPGHQAGGTPRPRASATPTPTRPRGRVPPGLPPTLAQGWVRGALDGAPPCLLPSGSIPRGPRRPERETPEAGLGTPEGQGGKRAGQQNALSLDQGYSLPRGRGRCPGLEWRAPPAPGTAPSLPGPRLSSCAAATVRRGQGTGLCPPQPGQQHSILS